MGEKGKMMEELDRRIIALEGAIRCSEPMELLEATLERAEAFDLFLKGVEAE